MELKTFQLSGTRELLTRERADEISKPLHEEVEFHCIKLSGKSFGVEAAESIAIALQKQKNLTRIDIADIIAGRPEEEALKALEILSSALRHTDPIVIDVSDNALGKKGIHSLRTLLGNKKNVEEIYINNNGLDTEAAELIQELLLHEKPTKLRIVHCVNNLLRNGGGKAIAGVLSHSPALESVILTGTRIGSEGGTALAKGLISTNKLRILDLSDNNFDEEGRKFLAKALKDQPNLISINLSSTGLQDDGVIAISKALSKTAPQLEVLNLAGNEVTAEAAEAIANCIKNKHSLRILRLEENELGNDGIKEIVNALSTGHDELIEVDFSVNELDDEGAEAVVNCLKDKRKLRLLALKDNDISEDSQEELKEKMADTGKKGVLILTDEDEEQGKQQKSNGSEDINILTQKMEQVSMT